jgi:hypothetical protein
MRLLSMLRSMGALVSDPASLAVRYTSPVARAPVVRIVHRVIGTFLIQQAGLQRTEAHTGAVTLIHLHCLVLDGVYRVLEGVAVFHEVRAPTAEQLQALLTRIIKRLMNRMHRDVQL